MGGALRNESRYSGVRPLHNKFRGAFEAMDQAAIHEITGHDAASSSIAAALMTPPLMPAVRFAQITVLETMSWQKNEST